MKQETLEESYLNKLIDEANKEFTLDRKLAKEVAIKFAKCHQEQDKNKYSEEEVIELLNKREDCINQTSSIFEYTTAKDWFEQFKKK